MDMKDMLGAILSNAAQRYKVRLLCFKSRVKQQFPLFSLPKHACDLIGKRDPATPDEAARSCRVAVFS
jgi:hypothetical protein